MHPDLRTHARAWSWYTTGSAFRPSIRKRRKSWANRDIESSPYLYGGQVATTHDQASKLLQSVRDDLAGREIDGAIAQLAQSGRPVAVMGFSMGAKHALAAALRNPAVHATVLWYGETINDPAKLRQLAGPALLVVGSHDGTSAAENSAAFSKAADAAGQGAEVYVYPGADHAFAQPLFNAGRTYDPVAANAAWLLSQDFLQRRLH